MNLVYKKNIVELINEALAEAKRTDRYKAIEAIEVTREEAEELHRLVFNFSSLRPFAFRNEDNNVKAFLQDLHSPKSKILYMGLPVRLKVVK